MHHVTTKFVRRILTADQKQQHVNICKELHEIASDDATFLSRVIAGDVAWIYSYDPETKLQSSQLKSPNPLRPKKVRQVKSKVMSKLIIFFNIKGLFTKNLSWQAKQSILHTTVMFYSNCVKMCKDFYPNFGDKRTDCN
jgi:hypothetical protein